MKSKSILAVSLLAAVVSGSAFSQDAANNTGATFFEGLNYTGEQHFYGESSKVVEVPSSLNDKFHSVKVGQLSKVFAWQHYGSGGKYFEWEEDQPNIDAIGGLSVLKVVPNRAVGVSIRLLDDTKSSNVYCMTAKVYGEGEAANVYSCDDNPNYQLVGTIAPGAGGENIVSQITVRGTNWPGAAINNGSVFFTIDPNGIVDIDRGVSFENFPDNMTIEKVGPSRFDLHLISEEPSWD